MSPSLTPLVPWPDGGLEILGRCPICGSAERQLVHDELRDLLFRAPGSWRLFRCSGCRLGYLDPRPDAHSIGAAYGSYYTHDERHVDDDPAMPGATVLADLKQRLLRHYLVYRFGAAGKGNWALSLPVFARPKLRRSFDRTMRSLPRPQGGNTLLDIGCGSGRFLAWARVAGWSCTGTEVDPVAAAQASAKGFEVHLGAAQDLVGMGRKFDAVTVSHVIEHVHDPVALLDAASLLLAPGGHFWIETPNMDAHGHEVFGRSWRGLEPPRHLQLFHPELLARLLAEAGLIVQAAPQADVWDAIEVASLQLGAREGRPLGSFSRAAGGEAVGLLAPGRREFITLTATKP